MSAAAGLELAAAFRPRRDSQDTVRGYFLKFIRPRTATPHQPHLPPVSLRAARMAISKWRVSITGGLRRAAPDCAAASDSAPCARTHSETERLAARRQINSISAPLNPSER